MKRVSHYSYFFSIIIALMIIVAAGSGIYDSDFYSGLQAPFFRLASFQDLLALTTIVPLLLTATWLFGRHSFRGDLTWIGVVGYLVYVYAGYAFGRVSVSLSLLHIGIFALSYFSLMARLAVIDAEAIRLQFIPVQFHLTSFFLIAAGLLIEVYWLKPIIPMIPDYFPSPPELAPSLVFIIQVMDIGLLGPLCLLTGLLLWTGEAWGYIFTAMLLIILTAKFGTMAPFLYSSNLQQSEADLISYSLALVTIIFLISFLKKLREERLTSFRNRISNGF